MRLKDLIEKLNVMDPMDGLIEVAKKSYFSGGKVMLYRKMNSSGAVNIPAQLRREMGYQKKDVFEIDVRDGVVILRPKQRRCVFCGAVEDDITTLNGKGICRECLAKVGEIINED